jgi:outer membrane biogenesis lipoprotein LolB
MKNVHHLRSVLLVTAMAFISACSNPSEKVEDAKTDVSEANKSLEQANMEYQKDLEAYRQSSMALISENERKIAELKIKVVTESASERVSRQERVANLEAKNSELRMKLKDYKGEGKENWEAFKTEFNHDMDELSKAFKDIGVDNVK